MHLGVLVVRVCTGPMHSFCEYGILKPPQLNLHAANTSEQCAVAWTDGVGNRQALHPIRYIASLEQV